MCIMSKIDMLTITQHTASIVLLIEKIKESESKRTIRVDTTTKISQYKLICYDMSFSVR